MKRQIIFLLFFSLSLFTYAEILNPVKWSFAQKQLSATEVELRFIADIDPSWHIYAMSLSEDGPVPTQFVFETVEGVKLTGKMQTSPATELVSTHDEQFDMKLSWYEKQAVFIQKLKIINANYKISGYVRYMSCDDKTCLTPVNVPFSFVSAVQKTGKDTVAALFPTLQIDTLNQTVTQKTDYWKPVIAEMKAFGDNPASVVSSLWLVFLGGFVGGLLALFTPCVWPIIPMTVSFFLKRNQNKRKGKMEATLYGLSIIFIYMLLGVLVTLIFGASALNTLSTNAVFNLIFFAILVVFALSFFGYFEITLPASWSSAINHKAEHTSGIASILLMAFTLVIVSFSCTGPIIGTLLVEVAVSGSLLAPAVGMFGFALALAVPFSLFALFPAWLNEMPRSGSWLNTVKVSLAFLEVGLALKFLSTADLTQGWGILPRPLFIGIWIVLAAAWAAYMFGFIRFPHDSKGGKISWLRRTIGIAALAFSVYLATGFWGAPLKNVSAFLPPLPVAEQHFGDFDRGMDYAKAQGKPVFIDFTGYGCVNCRKMEAAVFTNPEVKNLLSEFVIISLYVDDRTALDSAFVVSENVVPLRLTTIGEKWSYLQRYKFGANAQPYYVLLDNEGQAISKSYSYDENVAKFIQFLKMGLQQYARKTDK